MLFRSPPSPLVVTAGNTGPAKFIPLTNLPLFSNGAGSRGMSIFLNKLYQYLIGIAVILAVLEVEIGRASCRERV